MTTRPCDSPGCDQVAAAEWRARVDPRYAMVAATCATFALCPGHDAWYRETGVGGSMQHLAHRVGKIARNGRENSDANGVQRMSGEERVPRIPLAERPRFAAKMVAVWRWHHMAKGEDLHLVVYPGDWPDDAPAEIKGAQVAESEHVGGPGAVVVMGRVGNAWRLALNIFAEPLAAMPVSEVAICTVYMESPNDSPGDALLWMHPHPVTGETPMWKWAARP